MLLSVFAILPQLSNTVVKIEIEEIEGSIKVWN
jgi:hypothetical protein